jgi:ABC-2 type transport system ATP-binding protein
MWQIIRELVGSGMTILLTTQYLEEADQLADRVAVLDHGRVVATGTPDELKRRMPGGHARLHFSSAGGLDAAAKVLPGAARDDDALVLRIPADDTPRALKELLEQVDQYALPVERVTLHSPDLDDVFFALTSTPR